LERLNIIGYSRVSTIKQIKGHSLKIQKESIENYCKFHNYNIIKIYTDEGISAFKDRPQFDAMMKRVLTDDDVSGVIVHSFTRFGRSTIDLLNQIKSISNVNKTFISVRENIDLSDKIGKLLMTVLSAIAEYEVDIIKERMEAGKEYARIHGTKSGKPMHRPRKTIDWEQVTNYRTKKLSWNTIAKLMNVTSPTLIKHAREKGFKITWDE